MKKIIKKKVKRERVNVEKKDRFEFILEDIRDQIKLVAEGVSVVDEKLKKFKSETAENFRLTFDHFSNLEDEIVDIKNEIKYLKEKKEKSVDIRKFNLI